MRVGIDIDGVCTGLQEIVDRNIGKFIDKYKCCRRLDINMSAYTIGELVGAVGEKERAEIEDLFWKEYADEYLDMGLYTYVKEIIDWLHKRDHKVFIVSSRNDREEWGSHGKDIYDITIKEFKDAGIEVDGIYLDCGNKIMIVRDLALDIMVDDSPNIIKGLRESTKVHVVKRERRYNLDEEADDEIRTLLDLKEVVEKLDGKRKIW